MQQKPSWPNWANRFFPLHAGGLHASLAAVFRGAAAEAARLAPWDESFRHVGNGVTRIYLRPFVSLAGVTVATGSQQFTLDPSAGGFPAPWGYEWMLLRTPPGLGGPKAFCIRESEVDDFRARGLSGGSLRWGFGRPHPFKPDAKPNQLTAGQKPAEFAKWTGFEPVWVRLGREAGQEVRSIVLLRLSTRWAADSATLVVEEPSAEQVPEVIAGVTF